MKGIGPTSTILVVLIARPVTSALLNVHLPLNLVNNSLLFDKCPFNEALSANLALFQASRTEEINFFTDHSPHVTLFLSDFQTNNDTAIIEMFEKTKELVSNFSMCTIEIPIDVKAKVSGPYSMFPIPKTTCLQHLSDRLVKVLNPYITRPQPIPDWVYKLPIFTRLRKMWLIRQFGSPNVFADFEPHVTVGYDHSATVESRQSTLNALPGSGFECKAVLTTVGVGQVGVGGSVLQDGFLKEFKLRPS